MSTNNNGALQGWEDQVRSMIHAGGRQPLPDRTRTGFSTDSSRPSPGRPHWNDYQAPYDSQGHNIPAPASFHQEQMISSNATLGQAALLTNSQQLSGSARGISGPPIPGQRRTHRQQRGTNVGEDWQSRHSFHSNAAIPPATGRAYPQRARHQQHLPLDPHAYQRGNSAFAGKNAHQTLYNPPPAGRLPANAHRDQLVIQDQYLDKLCSSEVSSAEMGQAERMEKESFRRIFRSMRRE